MHPIKKVAHIKVVETKFTCRLLGVITVLSSTVIFVEFKAEIYSSPINGNQRISSGRQSVSSRPQRLDI